MGELSGTLEEFATISKEYYEKIQQILKDQYCWKCPMRSTSKRTNCNEIDAWIRLTGAFEKGIHQHLILDKKEEEIEFLTSRYFSKVIKKHSRNLKFYKTVVLKLKEDIEPLAQKGDLLFIKENPESIKAGDLVLWPQICQYLFYGFQKQK